MYMNDVKFFLETEYDDLGYVKRMFVSPCLIFKVQDAVFGKLYTVIDTAGKRAVVDSVYDTYDDAFNALVSNMRYALEACKAAERRL